MAFVHLSPKDEALAFEDRDAAGYARTQRYTQQRVQFRTPYGVVTTTMTTAEPEPAIEGLEPIDGRRYSVADRRPIRLRRD